MGLSGREDACAARWLGRSTREYQASAPLHNLHQQIADIRQVPYVATFMGGRAALYAVVRALDLQPGDQILIPAFTCQCVTNALTINGVEARFVDIESDTYGMDVSKMAAAITPRTRAVLIQYTFGLVCRDLTELLKVARDRGLWVIEDCAHATGGRWQGQLLGTLGDIAIFSSERSKIVNSIHGGWAMTSNPVLGERLQQIYENALPADDDFIHRLLQTLRHAWAQHNQRRPLPLPAGWLPQMQPSELSGLYTPQYYWRMAAPVAELLSLQLARLPELLEPRRAGAAFWEQWAAKQGIKTATTVTGAENTWLRFPVLLSAKEKRERETLGQALNAEIGVWFTTPMHPQPLTLIECPVGMHAASACINLPTWLW
ncbi:MAG: L-glutamine:2-deoxy-scyllo-inosose aminotransferase [Candidatus Erwinia impunctatus]|nr:L-glutamine:2-deoxy-scyllo-inosose aminotransferase [Culicoides impunctatus]